ncbi:MAG: DUF4296 domain-containing protein [Bacteroidetes bacterium]|nr:DUF4296 domain-containing protein [Bacteroidota bacterium]MBS1670932.1 DUF4296 domain-containing protein [Bacteroidota bacterium]
MIKKIIFIGIIISTTACKNNSQKILPIDTMKVVMFDLLSAEELNNMIIAKDTLQKNKKLNLQFYREALEKHHISKEAFFNSYKYLETKPDKMKLLFDSLAIYAERMKQKETKRLDKLVK